MGEDEQDRKRDYKMIFSTYFIYFIIASFFGWVWESFYMTIKDHEWSNRGFLFGPVIPIYGAGTIGIVMVSKLLPGMGKVDYPAWKIFLVAMIGSVVLEYATSYIMEKMFHAVWWDYSEFKFNLNGRICLWASLSFGVLGIFVMKVIYPVMLSFQGKSDPLRNEAVSLVLMLFFGGDLALSVASIEAVSIRVKRITENVNNQMDKLVDKLDETSAKELKERIMNSAIMTMITESSTAQRLAFHRVKRTKFSGDTSEAGERYLARLKKYKPFELMDKFMHKDSEEEDNSHIKK